MYTSLNNFVLKTKKPITHTKRVHASQKTFLRNKTASAIIIGDEILNGYVKDLNINYLATFLYEKGIELKRSEIVGDKHEDIAESIQRTSKISDYVFTSGGVGPTHDDITYESLAKAFNISKMSYHLPTMEKMKVSLEARNLQFTEASKRMVLFPDPCTIIAASDKLWVPIVAVENVYTLPGVPYLFQELLAAGSDLWKSDRKFTRLIVYTNQQEGDIADVLSKIQKENVDVKLGSYPEYGKKLPYKVKVAVEGTDEKIVTKVVEELEKELKGSRHLPNLTESSTP